MCSTICQLSCSLIYFFVFLDYDAPITESGHYTEKYMATSEMIAAYDPLSSILSKPDMPVIAQPTVYKEVVFDQFMEFSEIVASIVSICSLSNIFTIQAV